MFPLPPRCLRIWKLGTPLFFSAPRVLGLGKGMAREERDTKMKHQLKHETKGRNGAVTFTLSDTDQNKQIGKLDVSKGSLVWYDGYATRNNKYRVGWDRFIEFMKQHPAT